MQPAFSVWIMTAMLKWCFENDVQEKTTEKRQKIVVKLKMQPASNVYIVFIGTIFFILGTFVLNVVFFIPFAKFIAIFLSISVWYAAIPIVPFILFVSGFFLYLRKERTTPPIVVDWNRKNIRKRRCLVPRHVLSCVYIMHNDIRWHILLII